MLFIQPIYSCFSHYHVPNNGIAPFSAYKHTHTQPTFLYSLWWRATAPNVSFETLNIGQFILSTQLIITNYLAILSHWHSTTVFRNLPSKPTTPNYTELHLLHLLHQTILDYTYCTKLPLLPKLFDFMINVIVFP